MSVTVLVKNSCSSIGEGPHWEEQSNSLLYIDINSGEIHKYDTTNGKDSKITLDGTVGHVVPRASGGYVVGLGRRLVALDWDTKAVTSFGEVDIDKGTRFNDGKCDPSGRLWAGTMGLEEAAGVLTPLLGTLYSLEGDGQIQTRHSPVTISNGLAWSADHKTMYYIDSTPRQVFAFDFEIDSGNISNQRVVADFSGSSVSDLGYPDGMCIDTDGNLWVACFFAAKVVCVDPVTGTILRRVDIPAARITSCCFGGPNYDELFVTSSTWDTSEAEKVKYPLAGSVFKVTGLGVKGTPGSVYRG